MKIEIGSDVKSPEGYEIFGFGKLNEGDLFLDGDIGVQKWKQHWQSVGYYLKVRKVERWREINIDEVAEIILRKPNTRCRFGGNTEGLLRGFQITGEGTHSFTDGSFRWYSKCEILE